LSGSVRVMSRAAQPPEMAWTIDQSINVDRLSMDELKLIFNQAEKRLDETVKRGESIASKTMSMITLMAGLLIALSGYIISIWKGFPALTNKDWVGIVGCLYLLGLLIYVINNVMTHKYLVVGSQPEDLINSTYSGEDISGSKILLLMYINEIENYNWRIDYNTTLNRRCWRRYLISVRVFLLFPLVLALLYGVLEWIFREK
jgi:hypothetical protein